MAGANVRYRSGRLPHGEDELEIVGHGTAIIDGGGYSDFQGTLEVLGPASLSSLRSALARYADNTRREEASLSLVNVPEAKFRAYHNYEFAPEPIEFVLRGSRLLIRMTYTSEREDEPRLEEIRGLLAPSLWRLRAQVAELEAHPYGEGDPRTRAVVAAEIWDLHVDLEFPLRGRTLADAFAAASDAFDLLAAADGGALTREAIVDLVRAGRAHLLIGQTEGQWLDCKEAPYAADVRGKFEFAKDVASFVNEGGGLIVLGLRTRKRDEVDVISAVRPIEFDRIRVVSLRKTIEQRVYPPPEGLEIVKVDYGGGKGLALIKIPPQPEELKPFLVYGAILNQEIVGTHVSLVSRRGDATLALSAPAVHALLVAGRAVVRGLAQDEPRT